MPQDETLRFLLPRLAAFGPRPAVLAFGEGGLTTWSFADLEDRSMRLAGGLAARGVGPGEPVALLAPNRPEWLAARLALMALGAVAVPLDPLSGAGEVGHALADARCRRAFTTRDLLPLLREAAGGEGVEAWLLDGPGEAGAPGWEELSGARPASLPPLAPADLAAIFYTSGTTGAPKGVPLTHANIKSNLDALVELALVGPRDRVLLPLPLHHAYPFIVGMLLPLASGAGIVFPADTTGPEIVRALREGEATAMVGVPRLYEALVAGIETRVAARGPAAAALFRALLGVSITLVRRAGLRAGRLLFRGLHAQLGPRLRLLASGGARLEPEVEWRLLGLGWEVLTGYGLVETSSISTFNRRGEARVGGVGRPAPGVEVRIDGPDAEGRGEVLIRGPNVFAGYWEDEEATRAAFTADGWFRTGDRGVLSPDGHLTIVGRIKELIVLADGKNVTPEEVEAVYGESPYVREVAVLEHEGALVALVVPDLDALRDADTTALEEALRVSLGELSQRLPPYKRLSGYALTPGPLPRTRLGKFRRHLLPELYARARRGEAAPAGPPGEADAALLAGPVARKVWDWLAERFPGRTLTLDTSPQLDLGVDSLAWVDLGLEMEARLGVRLGEEAIARVATLRDLLREAEAAASGTDAAETGAGAGSARRSPPAADDPRWLEPRGPALEALAFVLHGLVRLLARLLFRLRVEGAGRLPRSGPVIIACNHTSDLDPVVLAAALPWSVARRARWGADAVRVFGHPVRRRFARLARAFPVDDRAPEGSLRAGLAALAAGRVLIWFPEGWRSPTGALLPFLPGIGVIVRRSRAPVVPAHVAGTFEAMPRDRALPRPMPVRVAFGPPLTVEELEARGRERGAPETGDPETREPDKGAVAEENLEKGASEKERLEKGVLQTGSLETGGRGAAPEARIAAALHDAVAALAPPP